MNHYGVARLREQVALLGPWAPLGFFAARFLSILFSAVPGTAYSILGGTLFGFGQGSGGLPGGFGFLLAQFLAGAALWAGGMQRFVGNRNLIDAAVKAGVKRFILVSSNWQR